MEEEIVSEVVCPETGWTIKHLRGYDNSVAPLWKRISQELRFHSGLRWKLRQIWQHLWMPQSKPVEMFSYYSPDGGYIGEVDSEEVAWIRKKMIQPELGPFHSTCTIGFSALDQKWYGWSHRANYGFGVGDRVDSPDHICATTGWTEDYLQEHPERDFRLPVGFEVQAMEDAKRMAIAFADAVG